MRTLFFLLPILFFVIETHAEPLEEMAVIGYRTQTSINDISSSVSVITEKDLQFIEPIHIQQALSTVPGVGYHRGNGQESLPSIRSAVLTGAGACGSVLVLEEGIAVRGAGGCNVNELFDTHFEQASHIEVLRGAGSVFYGSNSLTGSINVRLTHPERNKLSLTVGSDAFLRGKLQYRYINSDRQQGSVFVSLTDTDGYRDDAGYRQGKLSLRHDLQLDQWKVQIGATLTDLDQQTAGFITGFESYLDRGIARQNFNPEAFRNTQSYRVWVKTQRQLNDNAQLQFNIYARETDMDFLLHFLPGDPLEENHQQGYGLQSSIRYDIRDTLKLYAGIDIESSDFSLRQSQENPTRGSAFLRETIPTGVHYDYEVDTTQIAFFNQWDWQLSERWKVLAGFRVENIRYEYDNLSLDGRTREDGTRCGFGGCRYNRPADSRDTFTHVTPSVALHYQPSEQWRWHWSVADAYRAPQATELYRLQRAQSVADLEEVSATHYETGVSWRKANQKLALALYYIEQDNVIIRDAQFFNIDGQSTESYGVELEWQKRFHQQNDTQYWQIQFAGTLAEHQYDSDLVLGGANINGNQIDTAPNVFFNALTTWQFSPHWSTQLEMQHVGSYFTDPQNANSYPGHTVFHWSLRAQYENWQWRVRLENIADRRFAERADFTSFTQDRYFPGDPRSVFIELSRQF